VQAVAASILSSFETEAMKLAAAGFTILAASGDDGVAGAGARTCDTTKETSIINCACLYDSSSSNNIDGMNRFQGSNTWTGVGYFPNYPASCPYVTAVGATQGPESGSTEIAASTDTGAGITSGGGFSTYYAQPSWQQSAVSSYFSSLSKQPSAGFNSKGRAYPDVSLVGVNYDAIIGGDGYPLSGTSASTPVFAAMGEFKLHVLLARLTC
jgi:tripeptidyl-peptidase-1